MTPARTAPPVDGGRLPVRSHWCIALRDGRVVDVICRPPCDGRELLRRHPAAMRAWPPDSAATAAPAGRAGI